MAPSVFLPRLFYAAGQDCQFCPEIFDQNKSVRTEIGGGEGKIIKVEKIYIFLDNLKNQREIILIAMDQTSDEVKASVLKRLKTDKPSLMSFDTRKLSDEVWFVFFIF